MSWTAQQPWSSACHVPCYKLMWAMDLKNPRQWYTETVSVISTIKHVYKYSTRPFKLSP